MFVIEEKTKGYVSSFINGHATYTEADNLRMQFHTEEQAQSWLNFRGLEGDFAILPVKCEPKGTPSKAFRKADSPSIRKPTLV